MSNLLKDLYDKVESLHGKKLVTLLLVLFVVFTIIGLVVGYYINVTLNYTEPYDPTTAIDKPYVSQTYSFKGKIEYVNPDFYGVSYVLVDDSGEDTILLDAKDDKLQIAEGLYVTVTGEKIPNVMYKDLEVLNVEEVVITNVSN